MDMSSQVAYAQEKIAVSHPWRRRDQEPPPLFREFVFDPRGDAALAKFLAGSVARSRRALEAGEWHLPTEEAVQVLADLADAVAGAFPAAARPVAGQEGDGAARREPGAGREGRRHR